MAVNTYYFDASDAGPTDSTPAWGSDSNAFDGSTATVATASNPSQGGILSGEGTTAPASGGAITQVRARIYAWKETSATLTGVYWREDTAGTGTLLGSDTSISSTAEWSGYTTLSAPSGGWTWAKVQSLSVEVDGQGGGVADAAYFNSSEIEVTYLTVISLDTTAFRFYEDGTESGSTALATQGTDVTHLLSDGDLNFGLRLRLQNSGAAGLTTDDFQLQYSKNGGAYANVTSATSNVKGYASSNLTDGGATTNRLGSGTGSFVAGEVSEDGLVDNSQITASNYTEMLYSLTMIVADLVHDDYLDFRGLHNGSTITNTEVPRLTASREPLYKQSILSGNITDKGYGKNLILVEDE